MADADSRFAETAQRPPYLPCPVCKGEKSHHRDCPRPALGVPKCTCNPAEVENGTCVLCGNPFPVGGAV